MVAWPTRHEHSGRSFHHRPHTVCSSWNETQYNIGTTWHNIQHTQYIYRIHTFLGNSHVTCPSRWVHGEMNNRLKLLLPAGGKRRVIPKVYIFVMSRVDCPMSYMVPWRFMLHAMIIWFIYFILGTHAETCLDPHKYLQLMALIPQ